MSDKLYRRLGAHNPLGERKVEQLRQLSNDGEVGMHFRGPDGNAFTKVFGDFVHVSGGVELHRGLYAMGYFGGKTQVIGSVDGYEWELGGRIPADLDNFVVGGSFVHSFSGYGILVGTETPLGIYASGPYRYHLSSIPGYLTWDGTSVKPAVTIFGGAPYTRAGFADWLPEATVQRPELGMGSDGTATHTESIVASLIISEGLARPAFLGFSPDAPGVLYLAREAFKIDGALIDAHYGFKLSARAVVSVVYYVRAQTLDLVSAPVLGPPTSTPGYMFDGPLMSLAYTPDYARAAEGPWVQITAAMVPELDFVLSASKVPFNVGGADPNRTGVFNPISEQLFAQAASQNDDLILLAVRVMTAITPAAVWKLMVVEVDLAAGTSRLVDTISEASTASAVGSAYIVPVPGGMLLVVSDPDPSVPDTVYRYRRTPPNPPLPAVPAEREEAGELPTAARNCGVVTAIDDHTLVVPAYVDGKYWLYSAEYLAAIRTGPPLPLEWRRRGVLHPTAPAPSNPARTHLETFPRVLRLQEPTTDPAPAFLMLPWMNDYREPLPE